MLNETVRALESMPPPECAVCCKPVERVRREFDPIMCYLRFEFHCHGAVERNAPNAS